MVDQECPGCPLSALVTNPSSLPPPSLPPLTYWTQTCTDHECPDCPKSLFELSSVFPPLTSLPSTPPMPMITCISLGPLHPLAWCGVCQSWMVTGAFGYQRIAHWGTRQRWENFSWVKWGGWRGGLVLRFSIECFLGRETRMLQCFEPPMKGCSRHVERERGVSSFELSRREQLYCQDSCL